MNIGSASAVFLKNIHDVLVSGTILVYGIWNMVCGIWYENGIHSVFTYVLYVSCLGCLQCSAYIPCISYILMQGNNVLNALNLPVYCFPDILVMLQYYLDR